MDEGDSYIEASTPFTPDNILFQSIRAPNSTDSPYNKYVLGYDSSAQTVSYATLSETLDICTFTVCHKLAIQYAKNWLHVQCISIAYVVIAFLLCAQLWVSMDLGQSWVHIGDNVPTDRYYWRRLDSDIEGDLSTVYYEQKTSASSSSEFEYL